MKVKVAIGAFALAVFASGLGAAQERQKIVEPTWLKQPTPEDLFAVWPAKAAKAGRAVIGCVVTVQGALRACEVIKEQPAGAGYGAAALALAPQFLMRPRTIDGKASESYVQFPISFRCDEACPQLLKGDKQVMRGIGWGEAPSYDDFLAAYPKAAQAKKLAGIASLACNLTADGRLDGCRVMREQPRGAGFGRAAMNLSKAFGAPLNISPTIKLSSLQTHLTFAFDPRMLDGVRVVGKPRWANGPNMAEALAAYPKQALADGIFAGRAVVRCTVAQGGALAGCTPHSETPEGKGFAEAALTLMPLLRLDTFTEEGLPVVGGELRVPISFRIEDGPADPAE